MPNMRMIVRMWMGGAFGLFLMMWLPYLAAFATGFTVRAHVIALIAAVLSACGCCFLSRTVRPKPFNAEDASLLRVMLFTAVPLLIFAAYLEWTHNIMPQPDGLHVGQSTYGDLNLHLSIITSMRGAAVPADYSIFPGARLSYPFLTDTLSTSFMLMGMSLRAAVLVPSILMLLLTFCGYLILADRVIGKKRAAVLAYFLFFLNGGLGFLYSFDMIGVSQGSAGSNQMQAGAGILERLGNILNGWYQTPTNHAEFTTYNLRWSNVICDMLIPQRTILGGWCQLLPCLYLAYELMDSQTAGEERTVPRMNIWQVALLGVWAGGLVMVHTHSFFALGLVSIGWMAVCLIRGKGSFAERLMPWAAYGIIACLAAVPQLFTWTFGQVNGSDRFLSVHFNWVNNSNSAGLRDGYLWFYIKNIGLPFPLLVLSLIEKNAGRRRVAAGAFLIFVVAELFQFQPNEYDNNKLFYVWYMFGAMLAADYALDIFDAMKGLRARPVIAAAAIVFFFASAVLTCAREAVSDYRLFSDQDVEAAEFVEENTPEHAVFISWTEHINPVSSLAGRTIICGPDLWLYYHGLDTWERQRQIRDFYQDPDGEKQMIGDYGVDYIYIGSYERANLSVDEAAIARAYPLVFESSGGEIRIYQVPDNE